MPLFDRLANSPHLPRRTVRLRLTLLYGALFLISGAALLTITYLLVRHSTGNVLLIRNDGGGGDAPMRFKESLGPEGLPALPSGGKLLERMEDMRAQAAKQRTEQMRELLTQSGVALGMMAIVSIGLGWLMAGRVLAPLRTMATTTRRISEHNLHERLALDGPRDELRDLGETIDELLARLESAFEAQRRFVANASHELRTPLAMMRTSLDVAMAKPGQPPPELEVLDGKLREGLGRADRLLESFLELARAQHAGLPGQTTVSLAAVAGAAIARSHDAMAGRAIEVEHALDDVRVTGSETLLAHLVDNLIDNAIRHNEPGGWVRIELGAEGEVARLVVESGGRRLDDADVQGLAEPFRRLGTERANGDAGVGLGLSIVSAIAAAHGGRIELGARPAGGLRVAVELPGAAAA